MKRMNHLNALYVYATSIEEIEELTLDITFPLARIERAMLKMHILIAQ